MPGHREYVCAFGRSFEGLCLVVIEEQNSRVGKFQRHLHCVSLKKLFTSYTVLSLAAHPDQGVSHVKSNSCCTGTKDSVAVSNSIFQWVLERLAAQEMSSQEVVFSIGFLNRYCNGSRCREAATDLVMLLAPLCLSLLENTFLEFYLDEIVPQFVSFEFFLLSWWDKRVCFDSFRSNPQNFDPVVIVVTIHSSTGVQYLLVQHEGDSEDWVQLFGSKDRSFQLRTCLLDWVFGQILFWRSVA